MSMSDPIKTLFCSALHYTLNLFYLVFLSVWYKVVLLQINIQPTDEQSVPNEHYVHVYDIAFEFTSLSTLMDKTNKLFNYVYRDLSNSNRRKWNRLY